MPASGAALSFRCSLTRPFPRCIVRRAETICSRPAGPPVPPDHHRTPPPCPTTRLRIRRSKSPARPVARSTGQEVRPQKIFRAVDAGRRAGVRRAPPRKGRRPGVLTDGTAGPLRAHRPGRRGHPQGCGAGGRGEDAGEVRHPGRPAAAAARRSTWTRRASRREVHVYEAYWAPLTEGKAERAGRDALPLRRGLPGDRVRPAGLASTG